MAELEAYREDEGVELLKTLYERPEIPVAVDTETTGFRVELDHHCIGVSVAAVVDGQPLAHYFPTQHPSGVNCHPDTVAKLEYVLSQQGRLLVFANAVFDLLSLQTISGMKYDHVSMLDICTMAHLCNENTPISKSLDSLAGHYLGHGAAKVVDAYIEAEKVSGNAHVTPEEMWDYAVTDAVLTWRVWDVLTTEQVWQELPASVWQGKQRFIRVLTEMRRRGVRIDTEVAAEMIVKGEAEMKRLGAALGYPGKPTKNDPDPLPKLGPIALNAIFIDRLKLPVLKASDKTGKPSFDKTVMEQYDEMLEKLDSPEAKLIKEYRGWQKAVSAAYRPYLTHLYPDGRLRCSYKMHGTKTGRLSCSEPNLQQIPKSSDKAWNGRVKECFIGEDGYVLINADFSQLELRLGTVYAGEPNLMTVFNEDRDIFTEMAAELGFTRQETKTLVYSMQYGAGEKRIKNVFGVNQAQARAIRERYFSTYPAFKALADNCDRAATRSMQIRLWNGRYRHFQFASEAYKAMNSLIQGGAADIVEAVMCELFEKIDSPTCRMLMTVHDSVTFEVRMDQAAAMMPKIQQVMQSVVEATGVEELGSVKFAVEVEPWTAREAALMEGAA